MEVQENMQALKFVRKIYLWDLKQHKVKQYMALKDTQKLLTNQTKRASNDEPDVQLNCPTKKARNELIAQTFPGQPSVSVWQKNCQKWKFHDPCSQA